MGGGNIGDGWFLRGDLGLATSSTSLLIDHRLIDLENKSGVGTLFGGGYSMGIGRETRALFGLYTSVRQFRDEGFINIQAHISILF